MMLNISRTSICLSILIPMVFLHCPPENRWNKIVPESEFWLLARMCGYRAIKARNIQYQGEWGCYHYTALEVSLYTKYKYLGFTEKHVCENPKHNRKYSQGNNNKAPGCNTCWCCQKSREWKCYHYTKDEKHLFTNNNQISEKSVCEVNGRFYSRGIDKMAPGCGNTCWCCQRA